MSKYVFLDIETQQSFDDVGGPFPNQMDISIGVTYDYINSYKSWNEKDASELLRYINTFEFIIGFNIIAFDYEVLSQYDHENLLSEFEYKTIDLLSLIESEIGKRISLNEIAKATLGKKKISSGKDAIKYWRNGEIQKLIAYCQKDVQLTVLLFEYVQKNEQLYCSSYGEKTVISIELPEEAKTIELNLLSTRTWLEAYFEALLSSDSISRKQILVLKEKIDVLIEGFENKIQSEEKSEENEKFNEEEEDFDKEEKKQTNTNESRSAADITEPVDDLPF